MIKYKKLKKNDNVQVICGKDLGKSGKIIEIDRNKGRVLIEGINFRKKAMRKTQKDQTGGIRDIEAFMNISNVKLVCPKCKSPARVGFKIDDKKNKKRFCKKCNGDID